MGNTIFENLDRFKRWLDDICLTEQDVVPILDSICCQYYQTAATQYEVSKYFTKSNTTEYYYFTVEEKQTGKDKCSLIITF